MLARTGGVRCLGIHVVMGHRDTLTLQQAEVLRWIADGADPAEYSDRGHRIVAAALQRRGLVKVSGRGPTWTATITPRGRDYLERLDSSTPPLARQGNVSVTQQLVDDVIAAGGTATFPSPIWRQPGDVNWERRAAMAQQLGKAPAGKQLVVSRRGDSVQISLVDAPTTEIVAVQVPAKVGRLRPVARAFRDDRSRHEVTRANLSRATRIVHVLAVEAERRGYGAETALAREQRYGPARWSGTGDGHLVIRTDDCAVRLRLFEEGLGSRAYFDRYASSYTRSPDGRLERVQRSVADYEAKGTGRLRLELVGHLGNAGRTSKWADRKSWRLEDKLGEVFWVIEARSVDARHAAERKAVEEAERQQRWEAAMASARAAAIERRRGEALCAQVAAWHEAERIRAWCDAAAARHPTDPDTAAWLDWARDYADGVDSLATAPQVPEFDEIRPDELVPFLGRWSPYGPDRR
jgi:hypothetical protein